MRVGVAFSGWTRLVVKIMALGHSTFMRDPLAWRQHLSICTCNLLQATTKMCH